MQLEGYVGIVLEALGCLLYGRFLNVIADDLACMIEGLGKEEGVMAIAHSGIDHEIARLNHAFPNFMCFFRDRGGAR